MTLSEILAAIAAYVADDPAKAKEVARELRATAETKPVAQLLIDAGAGKKKGETAIQVAEKDAEIERLTDELEAAKADAETARKAPTEQQAAWEREKTKLSAAKEKAEQERDQERTARKSDAVTLARSRFRAALQGRVDEFGLDAIDRRFAERFRAKDDLSGVDVLDEDGDPIEAPKGKTAEELLAERAFETVPASNRVRQMNAGGGASGGGGGAAVTVEALEQEKRQSREYQGRF